MERLRSAMDIAFWMAMEWGYGMTTKQYSVNDADYAAVKELFFNEGRIPFGGALYDLFLKNLIELNAEPHSTLKHAENTCAVIESLEIHGLKYKMLEISRFSVYSKLHPLRHQ